ncbi:PadR family transcriptional regulator [bacterium D16-51]|nr:PadR family transcriptional regulator [bacterium D16-59]RKI62375.1 PadR family transcriptional regulator [bacterium D16-51]
MSTIDLIFLGSLCQSPKSAYELQKQIEERNLSRWVKIGSYTVYKKVVQYEAKGLVTSEIVKDGNMPEKTVYTLTEKGTAAFQELMKKFSMVETRIFLEFNAVIVNLAVLDSKSAGECIGNIRNSIHQTKQQISGQLPAHENIPLFGRTILQQQHMLLETLEKWEEIFEQQLHQQKGEEFHGNH